MSRVEAPAVGRPVTADSNDECIVECCACGEDFEVDDGWDTEGTCPHCGAELEWDMNGGTEEGFCWTPPREVAP